MVFAMGGYAGGVSPYALDGHNYYEYSAMLLKRDNIKVGALPAGDVTIAYEMRTPPQPASTAELTFRINGKEAATGGRSGLSSGCKCPCRRPSRTRSAKGEIDAK